MPSWSAFAAAAPALAADARERLDAHVHKTLATVRRDGAPRISGTETVWADGELWIGSMWRARKALDLRRDPRFALHSGSDDPAPPGSDAPGWVGDAKLAGVAVEVEDPAVIAHVVPHAPPGPLHLFRLEVREVSTVRMSDDGKGIVVASWTAERGVRTLARR
ncbi:pyridoxamine 5'-phosphate oxidase family protein [Patulibacter sp. SYSU D01012]|uniref:pyridoxamine 5'-phosphate oxidase family protein n=1 Tax=Patulibacter sp. SYSU D01012 TaxID=2817381 RepID=UPI001B300B81|nr:pyridoxamine 5'-phosphate oxidase family protein [Patulibacter sp. SYSU D01012]